MGARRSGIVAFEGLKPRRFREIAFEMRLIVADSLARAHEVALCMALDYPPRCFRYPLALRQMGETGKPVHSTKIPALPPQR